MTDSKIDKTTDKKADFKKPLPKSSAQSPKKTVTSDITSTEIKKISSKTFTKSTRKVANKPEKAVIPAVVIDSPKDSVDEQPEQSAEVADSPEMVSAKAGKRSTKVMREQEAEAARKDRIASGEVEDLRPKQHSNPTRSKLLRRGKKFQTSAKLIDSTMAYPLDNAVELAMKTSSVKFDATIELHVNLNVDPRHADQNVRDNLVLPSGTGRSIKIAVLTDDPAAATTAGADIAGNEEFLAQLDKGQMDFDILIAKPMLMAKLGKYARVLGPRGLMPNPKSGTVTTDVAKAVTEAKAGRVEYRVDSTGIVHLGIGKVSFTKAQLLANIEAVLTSMKSNKPQSVKSTYFKTAHLSTSMGPSIRIDLASIS